MIKRRRETWATRKLPPLTSGEIERHLDLVAWLMDKAGAKANLYLPIWRRLEKELSRQKDAETILAAARDRLIRSQGQTSARPS